MTETFKFDDGDNPGLIRNGLNANADELRQCRRPWSAPFDGDFCTYNDVDYDYVNEQGNSRDDAPGSSNSWRVKVYVAPTVSTEAGSKLIQRGSYAELKALPASSVLDEFIVQGEDINSEDRDINGPYERLVLGGVLQWAHRL